MTILKERVLGLRVCHIHKADVLHPDHPILTVSNVKMAVAKTAVKMVKLDVVAGMVMKVEETREVWKVQMHQPQLP